MGHSYLNKLLTIVFTVRDDEIRPISSRKANTNEKKIFEAGELGLCRLSS
ncbi:MAG: BrnT family toxin [Chitinophagales bacterium]|nr:BrnT family toxin [Chitinophagales bacterium]